MASERYKTSLDCRSRIEQEKAARTVAACVAGVGGMVTAAVAYKADMTSTQALVAVVPAFITTIGATGVKFANEQVKTFTNLLSRTKAREEICHGVRFFEAATATSDNNAVFTAARLDNPSDAVAFVTGYTLSLGEIYRFPNSRYQTPSELAETNISQMAQTISGGRSDFWPEVFRESRALFIQADQLK